MSHHLVICCDVSHGPSGTCGAFLPTGTTDESEAYAIAVRAGWSTGPDRCPGHTFRPRTTVRAVRRLRPATEETPTP
ncbi:hypothetical protein [Streptomyces rubiginosohelvolus]|uniref:hypothetical protein n=1 Tax=Streptomyces rubiginosohelvolus TaxID=67362 RepID=UPI003869F029|nr:hypothetical protein OG475_17745 [Streptomyces rubiginosohelvolus]